MHKEARTLILHPVAVRCSCSTLASWKRCFGVTVGWAITRSLHMASWQR